MFEARIYTKNSKMTNSTLYTIFFILFSMKCYFTRFKTSKNPTMFTANQKGSSIQPYDSGCDDGRHTEGGAEPPKGTKLSSLINYSR